MTRKVYRTAQGKMVDLGALMLQNESVRAVGNMKVNARGDLVDSNNRPIDTRNKQVNRQYDRQTGDAAVAKPQARRANSRAARPDPAPQVADPVIPPVAVEIPPAPEDFDDNFVKQEPEPAPAIETPGGGLAAAIAKARQIKQEPLKTARQIAQENAGVKKI